MRAATIAHDLMAESIVNLLTREVKIEYDDTSVNTGPEPTPSWVTRMARVKASEPRPVVMTEETRTGVMTRHTDAYAVILDGWRSTIAQTDRLTFLDSTTEQYDILTIERIPHCPLTRLIAERVTT